MDVETVIMYFGGITATARALGVAAPSVSEWRKTGRVPRMRQYQIQVLTRGKLTMPEPAKPAKRAPTSAPTGL